jgi:hypothetical protein
MRSRKKTLISMRNEVRKIQFERLLCWLMGRVHDMRRLDGFRWHDIYSCTTFHNDRFRHSNNITSSTGEATMFDTTVRRNL